MFPLAPTLVIRFRVTQIAQIAQIVQIPALATLALATLVTQIAQIPARVTAVLTMEAALMPGLAAVEATSNRMVA